MTWVLVCRRFARFPLCMLSASLCPQFFLLSRTLTILFYSMAIPRLSRCPCALPFRLRARLCAATCVSASQFICISPCNYLPACLLTHRFVLCWSPCQPLTIFLPTCGRVFIYLFAYLFVYLSADCSSTCCALFVCMPLSTTMCVFAYPSVCVCLPACLLLFVCLYVCLQTAAAYLL